MASYIVMSHKTNLWHGVMHKLSRVRLVCNYRHVRCSIATAERSTSLSSRLQCHVEWRWRCTGVERCLVKCLQTHQTNNLLTQLLHRYIKVSYQWLYQQHCSGVTSTHFHYFNNLTWVQCIVVVDNACLSSKATTSIGLIVYKSTMQGRVWCCVLSEL